MVISAATLAGGIKLIPVIGGAAVGAGQIAATIGSAIKTSTIILGIGKVAIIPLIIVSLAYFHYDVFDPENRPYNVQQVDMDYDFIVIGAGTAGSVVASRLSEIPEWKVLLLEAGGQETEITDVPILSLYLHKSKLDWKYRWVKMFKK